MTDEILNADVTQFHGLTAAKAQFNPLPPELATQLEEVSTRLLAAGYTLDPFAAPLGADTTSAAQAGVTKIEELVEQAKDLFVGESQPAAEQPSAAPAEDTIEEPATAPTVSAEESRIDDDEVPAPNLVEATVIGDTQPHIVGVNGRLTSIHPGEQLVSPEEYEVLKNAGLLQL